MADLKGDQRPDTSRRVVMDALGLGCIVAVDVSIEIGDAGIEKEVGEAIVFAVLGVVLIIAPDAGDDLPKPESPVAVDSSNRGISLRSEVDIALRRRVVVGEAVRFSTSWVVQFVSVGANVDVGLPVTISKFTAL